jgi:outer membrane receptor protein involved in Fe transport
LFSRYRLQAALFLFASVALRAQSNAGSISGFVLDGQTGRPIVGVAVTLDDNTAPAATSDSDGRFTVPAPAGTHALKFRLDTYSSVDLSTIIVKEGETTEASALMSGKSAVTSVDVVERIDAVAATSAAMLTERKLSSVVSDNISRQELSDGTAGDAAGALEKVTGVSVVGDGFVFVRGLGERYSATQLNGALIPTTEPEKRVVPLDLFPAGMIDNIKILKTYSPDLPAEFSGGLVQMQTIDFPTQKMFTISGKLGHNSVTTGNSFLNNPGGGAGDFFGFGSGSRSLPSAIPANKRLFAGQFNQSQLQSFGQAFADVWEPTKTGSMRPAVDWSAVGGGTFGRFGIVGAFSFSNKPQVQSELQRYLRQGDGKPIIFTEYNDYREYSQTARMGAVFNTAVRLNALNKIVFKNTFTHDSDSTAREFAGRDGGTDTNLSSQRLRYVERLLFSTGVEGTHSLHFRNALAHWQMTYSRSQRDEPDLREVFRGQLPNGTYSFAALGSSGLRFFSNLDDRIYEPQGDFSVPFFKGRFSGLFKIGGRVSKRQRDFNARRFLYVPQRLSTLDLTLPSNQLFGASNIRPDGFQIIEFTRGTDAYTANMDIYAGYAMVDLSLGPRWRLIGGLRVEDAEQTVVTVDNQVPNAVPVTANLANRDPAPALNAIYALSPKANLRFSVSRTLSRPDFRELSPFDFNNTLGGFVTAGNPNLKRASILNYDARWEHFSGGNQLIAASVFAKMFTDPIEQTIIPSNDLRQTFVNAKGARNIGFELEFRRSLGSFSRKLAEFAVSSNFTFVDSNIQIKPADATLLTSQNRPLLGQSRYIANGIVEWAHPKWFSNARFDANYVSRRITDVGTFLLPDIYQQGNTILNFVYRYSFSEKSHWNLRVEGENLTNNRYWWQQGDIVQREYRLGRTFQVGFTYSLF